jgi:hypothetical protein
MKDSKDCDCGICSYCSPNTDQEIVVFPELVLSIIPENPELDSSITKLIDQFLGNEDGIILLNKLRIDSGIIKVAAKHKPNNPKLWKKCLSEAKRRYEVCPSAYCNGFAAKLYKKKGGTWRTVKK